VVVGVGDVVVAGADVDEAAEDKEAVLVGEYEVVRDNVDASIAPELIPADAVGSALVATVMPLEFPAVAAPMVRPDNVMVTAVVAAMPTTAVVMTMELPEMTDAAVMVLTDVLPAALAAGLGVAAKNPAG
jgi:hypothetical protein